MAFSATDVKNLREMTGVGMMDCKKALVATDGDMDKAVESFAVDQDMVGRIFDGDAQPAKTVYRGETVRTL